jgi:hypothetical protein
VSPSPQARAPPAAITASDAPAGVASRTTRNTPTSGSTRAGCSPALSNTPVTKRSSTPSQHGCGDRGRDPLDEPRHRGERRGGEDEPRGEQERPHGASIPTPVEAPTRAAPGVDQAVITGIRWRTLR